MLNSVRNADNEEIICMDAEVRRSISENILTVALLIALVPASRSRSSPWAP
ncbi:MAG: hypothetical protein M3272_02625 [Actinomycetota bacterium]|nr:hypothetical protein [Actinomycetota bacterium]